jgi:hypothetical protein
MIIDTITWLYILIALAVVVFAFLIKQMSKIRVWIKTSPKAGRPMVEIGYLDMVDDGSAGEVHLPGSGGKAPVGRVVVNPQSKINNGYVEVITTDIDDDSVKPRYIQCGYICFDDNTVLDKYGYIYKQIKGSKKKELLGYCARPSAPNVPTLTGERSWKTLWLVKTLHAYSGKPEAENGEGVDSTDKKTDVRVQKLMNIKANKNDDDINAELPLEAPEGDSSTKQIVDQEQEQQVVQTAIPDVQPDDNAKNADAGVQEEMNAANDDKAAKEGEPDNAEKEGKDTAGEDKETVEDGSGDDEGVESQLLPTAPNDSGKKKSKPVQKTPVAIVTSYGFHFFSNDYLPAESRACAYAMLCRSAQKRKYSEYYKSSPYGWADTALLTTLIYSVAFLMLYTVNTGIFQMPLLGDDILAFFILIAFYFLLWVGVRLVKIDCIENSNSFQSKLDLLNKNLSLGALNIFIILLALPALYFTYEYYDFDLMPLIVAIMVGVVINMMHNAANRKWVINSSYNDNDDLVDEDESAEVVNPSGDISKLYEWSLGSKNSSIQLRGSLTLYFSARDIADMRQCNPFFAQRKDKSDKEYIIEMFNEQTSHKSVFLARVKYVAAYINKLVSEHNLTPLDKIQFTLDFVQEPNIQFVRNRECKVINYYDDYIRYPDETLYDKEGDSNSKSLLAAMLFHSMGYNVMYLASRKYQHAAIGIEVNPVDLAEGWYGNSNDFVIRENGVSYIYCETTGDKFYIGNTIEGMTLDDFDEKVILPYGIEGGNDYEEDIPVGRIYNWDLDSSNGNILHGNLTIDFCESEIEQLREINPFRTYGRDGNDYEMNIRRMFNYLLEDSKRTEHVRTVADYIKKTFRSNMYPELDMVQFALDFVQAPNITYCVDEDCASIDFAKEYMRYPDEVLFDKEGDCDCKSSLAAAILHELGYNVVIMLSQKLGHAAIGVECKDEWLSGLAADSLDKVLREYNGRNYLYCETTGDGYRVGNIKENESIQDFDTIVEILV